MSYKSEWEAILKLGDLSSDLVNEYSNKLSSLCTSEFSMFDDTFKKEVLKDQQISNIDHIDVIIYNSKVMQTRANIFTDLGSTYIKESSFYRFFRAAVLANRKLNSHQVTRDDLVDPVEVLEVPHNSTRSDISSKIFIRDCYRTLVNILLNSKTASHVLFGTPGIGKSQFAFYFLFTLIRLGIPFIIDSSYNNDKSKFYLLKSGGYLVHDDIESILDELGDRFFWYVVDGCKHREFVAKENFKLFYIDTATEASNLNLNYLTRSCKYFFPCWTLDEIEKCINKCSIRTNTEPKDNPLYKQLFKIVGGVPRYVFASTIQDSKDYIKRAIIDCNIDRLIDSLDYSVFSDKYISKLVQPIVDNSNLALSKVEFVSDYVVEDLVDVRKFQLLHEMTTLISIIEKSESNAIVGRILEALMIRKFKEGSKRFLYRGLLQDKGNKQVDQFIFNVPELEEVLFDESSFMNDLKSQVNLENHKHVLLVPKNKKLDVDAFMLPNICFKFTAKQQTIAVTNSFKNILDVMRNICKENQLSKDDVDGDNFKFKYIFVVPSDRCYENFAYQAVKCKESPTEQDLEKTKNETEELKDIALADLINMTRQLLDMNIENSVSEIEKMKEKDEEELKRKRTQLNVNVETKAQLVKIIEIATRYKNMKTDLEAEISEQIDQYVLKVEFNNY